MPETATVDSSLDLAPVSQIVARYAPFTKADVIGALQDLQEAYGYLPQEVMDELARVTGVPVSHLWGVATFYAQFYLEPHGKHTVRLCRGTACHVRGTPQILAAIERHLGIQDGETTADRMFSIETVACLGTCFLSPVMLIGSRYFGKLTPDGAVMILQAIAKGG